MKDILIRFLYNVLFRVKYYRLFERKANCSNRIVVIFDRSKNYCGLADIIKAIVGIYYIAKINGMQFKIYCKYPLVLSDYLEPASVNWLIDYEEINRNFFQTKVINYTGVDVVKPLKRGYEYHLYNFKGKNILQNTQVDNWEVEWHKLFVELFRPTVKVESILNSNSILRGSYYAVHVRLLNCLDIEEPLSVAISYPLDPIRRGRLLNCLYNEIDKLNSISRVVVFTDSQEFASLSKEMGYSVLDGSIGHLSYNKSEDITLKTFVDWFAISRADKVFSLRGGPLYNSAFPKYASLISNTDYQEINVSDSYEG